MNDDIVGGGERVSLGIGRHSFEIQKMKRSSAARTTSGDGGADRGKKNGRAVDISNKRTCPDKNDPVVSEGKNSRVQPQRERRGRHRKPLWL